MIIFKIKKITSSIKSSFTHNRHFLPYGRADLTASASLQPIRSIKRDVPSKYHPFALCAYSKGGTLGNVPLFSLLAASPLQQSRLVNNPACLNYL
jgi:hypothetical protein